MRTATVLALAIVVVGCGRKDTGAAASSTGRSPVAPIPAPSAATSASSAPSASASAGPIVVGADPQIVAALTRFFSNYKDGSDFTFLGEACRPTLDQFLTMKNVTVAAVEKSARTFFRDKSGVEYKPDLAALKVETRPEETMARLPVEMTWEYPLPADQMSDDIPTVGDAGVPVTRDVTVDVAIAFNPVRLITRYVETHVHMRALRETSEPNCLPEGVKARPMRTVYDLGDTYTSGVFFRGGSITRHVHTPDGDVWELDNIMFAVNVYSPAQCDAMDAMNVDDCLSASAASASECLKPVGDGGT